MRLFMTQHDHEKSRLIKQPYWQEARRIVPTVIYTCNQFGQRRKRKKYIRIHYFMVFLKGAKIFRLLFFLI